MENGTRRILLQCLLLFASARSEEVFNTTPAPIKTNFSCFGRSMGFYADVEANCKVYHTCDDHGNKFTYRCPEETAFRQDALICDHAHLVDCKASIKDNRTAEPIREQEKADTRLPSFYTTAPFDPRSNSRGTYSRSFQVIQPPRSSASLSNQNNQNQPGFVFSASVFLRDREESRDRKIETKDRSNEFKSDHETCQVNGERSNPKNDLFASFTTSQPFINRFDPNVKDNLKNTPNFSNFRGDDRFVKNQEREEKLKPLFQDRIRSTAEPSTRSTSFGQKDNLRFNFGQFRSTTKDIPTQSPFQTRGGPKDFLKSPLNYNRDYPYVETLRSIQANARSTTVTIPTITTVTSTTKKPETSTEISVRALTMSLKPLVPNELEYDPYYPQSLPTTTEAYYTPSFRAKGQSSRFSTQPPLSEIEFEIPAVLPDLNSLEDLLDRRKLFYIPRVKLS